MERKTDCRALSEGPVAGWYGTTGRSREQRKARLSSWANGSMIMLVFQMKFRRKNHGYAQCEGSEHIQVRA